MLDGLAVCVKRWSQVSHEPWFESTRTTVTFLHCSCLYFTSERDIVSNKKVGRAQKDFLSQLFFCVELVGDLNDRLECSRGFVSRATHDPQ